MVLSGAQGHTGLFCPEPLDKAVDTNFCCRTDPVATPEPTPEPPAEDTTDAAADAAADGADLTADAPQDDTQSQE